MSDDFNKHEVTLSVRVFDVEDVKEAIDVEYSWKPKECVEIDHPTFEKVEKNNVTRLA